MVHVESLKKKKIKKPCPSLLLPVLEGLPVAGCLALNDKGWVAALMEELRPCLQGAVTHPPALTSTQYTYASLTGDGPREDAAVLQPTG